MITREIQPDFPEVDLTERNVDFLRIFLSQPSLTHTISPENPDGHLEDFLTQFDLGSYDSGLVAERQLHIAAREAINGHLSATTFNQGQLEITYGYTLQGILTEIISPREFLENSVPLVDALRSLKSSVQNQSVSEFLDATKRDFLLRQKNTAQLIGESAAKLSASAPESALLGASLRRRIELDSRDYWKK